MTKRSSRNVGRGLRAFSGWIYQKFDFRQRISNTVYSPLPYWKWIAAVDALNQKEPAVISCYFNPFPTHKKVREMILRGIEGRPLLDERYREGAVCLLFSYKPNADET